MPNIQLHARSERSDAFRFRKLAMGVLRFATISFLLILGVAQIYANVRTFGMWGFIGLLLVTPLISLVLVLARIRLAKTTYAQRCPERVR